MSPALAMRNEEARASFGALLRSHPAMELPRDNPICTVRGVAAREAHRFDPCVVRCLGAIWEGVAIEEEPDSSLVLHQREYCALHGALVALLSSGAATLAERRSAAEHEWEFDKLWGDRVDRSRFVDILFLLADLRAVGVGREPTRRFFEGVCNCLLQSSAAGGGARRGRLVLRDVDEIAQIARSERGGDEIVAAAAAATAGAALLERWGGPAASSPFGTTAAAADGVPMRVLSARAPSPETKSSPSLLYGISPWEEEEPASPQSHNLFGGSDEAAEQRAEERGEEGAKPRAATLVDASRRGDAALVRKLLSNVASGAAVIDVDAPGPRGASPIIHAARGGHAAVLVLLLGGGADLNAVDVGGNTALHVAYGRSHNEIVAQLIAAGASRDALNAAGIAAHSVGATLEGCYTSQLLRAARRSLFGTALTDLARDYALVPPPSQPPPQQHCAGSESRALLLSFTSSPAFGTASGSSSSSSSLGSALATATATTASPSSLGAAGALVPQQFELLRLPVEYAGGAPGLSSPCFASPPGAHKSLRAQTAGAVGMGTRPEESRLSRSRQRRGQLRRRVATPSEHTTERARRRRAAGGEKRRTNPRYRAHSAIPDNPLHRVVRSTIDVKPIRAPLGWYRQTKSGGRFDAHGREQISSAGGRGGRGGAAASSSLRPRPRTTNAASAARASPLPETRSEEEGQGGGVARAAAAGGALVFAPATSVNTLPTLPTLPRMLGGMASPARSPSRGGGFRNDSFDPYRYAEEEVPMNSSSHGYGSSSSRSPRRRRRRGSGGGHAGHGSSSSSHRSHSSREGGRGGGAAVGGGRRENDAPSGLSLSVTTFTGTRKLARSVSRRSTARPRPRVW